MVTDKNIPEYNIIKNIAKKRKLRNIFINYSNIKYDLTNFKLIGNFQKKI